jgi:hypothetical protein
MGVAGRRGDRALALSFTLALAAGCAKASPAAQQQKDYPTVPEAALLGVARTNLDSPRPTSAQLERKRQSEVAVRALGLPILDGLPVHVLLWALGYLPAVNPPDKQADVAKEIGILREKGRAAFIKDARLRSMKELLDLNDLYYRLNWAAVDLRIKGQPSPKANEEIIVERHRALNWLIRYMNQEWDDVTTDT